MNVGIKSEQSSVNVEGKLRPCGALCFPLNNVVLLLALVLKVRSGGVVKPVAKPKGL